MGKKETVYMYTMEYYSARKEQNLAICNNMNGTKVYYAKQIKSEKDRYRMISLIWGN